jgi:ectoine hydroxylase-related dioxygenase (phytanoyl-CoA dioxygenase family)
MQSVDPGFSITESLFERREMHRVGQALATGSVPRTKAGLRNALCVPAARELASHRGLVALAATFVGNSPIPFRATLFDKSAASNWLVAWHQDTSLPVRQRVEDAAWGPWSMKGGVLCAIAPASALAMVVAVRVHLDDSTAENGPLRVLPGSHANGVLTRDQILSVAATIAPVTCLVSAGGVVAMRPLVVHASSKVSHDERRRVLHIEYASSVHLGAGIELAVG